MAVPLPTPTRGLHAGAFTVWLILQLLALAISAGRFPLTARYTKTGEQNALEAILIVQILASSLLAPQLLRNVAGTTTAIATAWPFAALASFASDAFAIRATIAELYVILWIIALALWIQAARMQTAKLLISAVATLLSIGGPLLWYLHAEFVTESWDLPGGNFALFSPIVGANSLIAASASARTFLLPAISTVIGMIVLLWQRRIRAKMRTSVPAQ